MIKNNAWTRCLIYERLTVLFVRIPARPQKGVSLLEERALSFDLNLDSHEAIADLLTMTPHLYRASQEGKENAAALHNISLSIDVHIMCFQRDHE